MEVGEVETGVADGRLLVTEKLVDHVLRHTRVLQGRADVRSEGVEDEPVRGRNQDQTTASGQPSRDGEGRSYW